MNRVVVLLGASGRVGRVAHPLFVAAGFDVVGVARTLPPVPTSGRSIAADLTRPDDRTRIVATVDAWTVGYEHVYVADSVLDRGGVDAMRASVHGATDTVAQLHELLTASGRTMTLVAASTTAVLARCLFQTPYGRAKRRQVITYARTGMPGVALLLPQLAPPDAARVAARPTWSYEDAARRLVGAALTAPRAGLAIHVPALAVKASEGDAEPPPDRDSFLLAHLNSLVLRRDSMHAHRAAARSRLRAVPRRLRHRVDHHVAPVDLARRLAHRYQISVIEERAHEPTSTDGGAAHA